MIGIGKNWPSEKQYKLFKYIRAFLLIEGPIAYLVVAGVAPLGNQVSEVFNNLVLYILLVVAALYPLVFPIIKNAAITQHRLTGEGDVATASLFVSIQFVGMAFIHTSYILGFIVFLLSRRLDYMLYFYPIGLAWTLLRWPSREKFDAFVKEYSQP
ncbi:MAG: hypothetical protein JSU65_13835 [Candidatus Zixiibacteriota bacterium]|nr:MAG: hypothetical protein JSU65_13835 [candidate division Zixibacteria bacterium]